MSKQLVTTLGVEQKDGIFSVRTKGFRWNGSEQVPTIYLHRISTNTARSLVSSAWEADLVVFQSLPLVEWREMEAEVELC